ncbi:prenylated Rab acceptor protein 1 isoform X2 [Monodelphis domestica]|uniref:prenylated Rab acceptor protein 1 isoform X2 n=1 Tax=Monodelphis domestica TaxID=13616 RepID=UPI0024E1FAEB|nr:prenylated Rab acceptor protein 1 isoform X2 [Monodelphis domestica]XP_056653000.1 prenylated Rab acceptor protein 1 isoform X2 [Monodelphis domestica]
MAAVSDLFNPAMEEEGPGPSAKTLLPKLLPSGSAGREWLEHRRATIRPWSHFLDQRRFSRPRNLGELCRRLVRNVEHYQSNYVFVFLGLILYCVITSPMLLVALAVFFGACYILYLRTLQSKLVLFGREVSPAHQYGLAGGISFPFFWLAGAGSAVFWVLGATLVVIGSHAAFHQLEAADGEELQMESV